MITKQPVYTWKQWGKLLLDQWDRINKLGETKGREYSGQYDRLLNFRRNAAALNLNKKIIWAVYAAKHWDAIIHYISNEQALVPNDVSEPISGRIDDLITYLILLQAMLEEDTHD